MTRTGPEAQCPAGAGRERFRWCALLLLSALSVATIVAGTALAAGDGRSISADEIAIGDGIGCYERPSLNASAAITHATADPVATCAKLWREGVIDVSRGPASPHLVACTGRDRPVYVFPAATDAVCDRLGLVPLPGDYAARGVAWGRAYSVYAKLDQISLIRECASPRAVGKKVRQVARGLEKNVSVKVQPDASPCAGEYKVLEGRIVIVTISAPEWELRNKVWLLTRALRSLIKTAQKHCVEPARFREKAGRRLYAAGLRSVSIRISGDGACVAARSGYAFDRRVTFFEFSTQSRSEWARDRRPG